MNHSTFNCRILFLLIGLFSLSAVIAQTDTAHFYRAPDGTNIYYEVHGKGFPVVLVHGFIVNASNWKKSVLYRELLQSGYQVILVDLRGNGLSDKPHDAAFYENDAQAKDIMGILTELKITQYHAIGYSRGSIIAARLLVLDKRLEKTILGGMGTEFTNPEWPRRIMFYHALMGEDVPELKNMVAYVQEAKLDRLALAYQQKEQPSTPKEVLQALKKNVLVICGDKDSDNGLGSQLAALIPGAQFKEVPGNHNQAVNTLEFAAAALQFFR
ncbi:MAG: hypothetical protein RLZZ28_1005 [Bacteroidota bacterium]